MATMALLQNHHNKVTLGMQDNHIFQNGNMSISMAMEESGRINLETVRHSFIWSHTYSLSLLITE